MLLILINESKHIAMIVHLLRSTSTSSAVRVGAPQGQKDMDPLVKILGNNSRIEAVVLDYKGIQAVNGSYVRATIGWLLNCARIARLGEVPPNVSSDPWAVRSLPIRMIFIQNVSDDVRNDINSFLKNPDVKFPCLEVRSRNKEEIQSAQLVGHLDRQLLECLQRLYAVGGSATASDLYEKYRGDNVQITAWNNRLAGLYERLLVNRQRNGRAWMYQKITNEITDYGI